MCQFHFPRSGCLVLPWDLSVVQLVHHRELPKKREIMRSLKDPFTQRRNMKSSRELFRTKEMLLNVLTLVYWLSTLNRFAYLCISFTNLYNCAILPFLRLYASGKKEDRDTTCATLRCSVYFLHSLFCVHVDIFTVCSLLLATSVPTLLFRDRLEPTKRLKLLIARRNKLESDKNQPLSE